MDKQKIESLIQQFEFSDFKWIIASDIKTSQWVRMKCLFGCGEKGRPACPPNMPSVEECRAFIDEYKHILVFHFEKEVDYHNYPKDWAKALNNHLMKLEREIFLSGHPKTFLLLASSCNICNECVEDKGTCKHPDQLRPNPEALGIDVYSTARGLGWPIEVLNEKSKMMNRYAFIFIE